MAYSEELAERVRRVLGCGTDPLVGERKMFGGLAFMLGGNMAVGIVGDDLMVRVGPDAWQECLALPGAREMDFTGKSMKGMVYVAADAVAEDADLDAWVGRGTDFAGSLPPK
jgi:TfoX/Sxy family transcriptional regulator of competence genes